MATLFRGAVLGKYAAACCLVIAVSLVDRSARALEMPSEFCGANATRPTSGTTWNDDQWRAAYPTFARASALDAKGDFKSAIDDYKTGLEVFPYAVEQRLRLGVDYYRVGSRSKADSEWQKAISMAAQDGRGEFVYCQGDTFFRQRAFREAFKSYFDGLYPTKADVAAFDMGAQYTDSGAAPLIRKGLIAATAGDFESAKQDFESAKALAPDLQLSNFFLADTQFERGDIPASRTYWFAVLDGSGMRTPDQHGPDRIQLAAATLLIWIDGIKN